MALSDDDLPEFDRPIKAISAPVLFGSLAISGELVTNFVLRKENALGFCSALMCFPVSTFRLNEVLTCSNMETNIDQNLFYMANSSFDDRKCRAVERRDKQVLISMSACFFK